MSNELELQVDSFEAMGFREKLLCTILLMIAKMIADDRELKRELSSLSTHINVRG